MFQGEFQRIRDAFLATLNEAHEGGAAWPDPGS